MENIEISILLGSKLAVGRKGLGSTQKQKLNLSISEIATASVLEIIIAGIDKKRPYFHLLQFGGSATERHPVLRVAM